MEIKQLLERAANEIVGLRKANEILDAQMGVVTVFAAALGLKRNEGGMTPDVLYEMRRTIAELDKAETDNPRADIIAAKQARSVD